MQTSIHINVIARPFYELESGDKFLMIKDIQGGGWSPIYTKIMNNVRLNNSSDTYSMPVHAVNSIGGMQPMKDDDLVIVIK